MDFRVLKSDDGRKFVQSKDEDFLACYKNGEWVDEMMFEPCELQELPPVEDAREALSIIKEAKKALSRW